MEWLKKNLFFIGWGALATVLTVVAVIYVFSAKQGDREVQEAVELKRNELERLVKADPQPNATNIAAVRRDENQARQFVVDARRMYSAPQLARTDNAAFKKQLEDSLYQLTQQAASAPVAIPTNYQFSFAVQKAKVQFSPGSLEPLLARLSEVKFLCSVLFGAGVHSLDSVCRAAVAPDDDGTAADILLHHHPRTNLMTGLISHPYVVTFTSFTRGLGLVIDALNQNPPFVLIKNITVDPAANQNVAVPSDTGEAEPPAAPAPDEPVPGFSPLRGAAARALGPQTILDQKLLRITLTLEFLNAPSAK